MTKIKNLRQRRLSFPTTCVCGGRPATFKLWEDMYGTDIARVMSCRCLNPICVDCRGRLCRLCGAHRDTLDECFASDWKECFCQDKTLFDRSREMAWRKDTPSENALIWNPAYSGKEGKEMAGILGDSLTGVCLDVRKVVSKVAKGEEEFHVIIGSDDNKIAEATLRGDKILSDAGFLFICGSSRWKMGSTFVIGRFYTLVLKELKDIGKENKYALYERYMDDEYLSPAFAGKTEEPLPF